MTHITPLSRTTTSVSLGTTTAAESIIELLLAVIFKEWDNFSSVYQNLQKFYAKT
jgi:hypothetical protein